MVENHLDVGKIALFRLARQPRPKAVPDSARQVLGTERDALQLEVVVHVVVEDFRNLGVRVSFTLEVGLDGRKRLRNPVAAAVADNPVLAPFSSSVVCRMDASS